MRSIINAAVATLTASALAVTSLAGCAKEDTFNVSESVSTADEQIDEAKSDVSQNIENSEEADRSKEELESIEENDETALRVCEVCGAQVENAIDIAEGSDSEWICVDCVRDMIQKISEEEAVKEAEADDAAQVIKEGEGDDFPENSPAVEALYVEVENPSWEYYLKPSAQVRECKPVKLREISKKGNNVSDVSTWISDYQLPSIERNHSEDRWYSYEYAGDNELYPTIVYAFYKSGVESGALAYEFDFAQHAYPDEWIPEDSPYVYEYVRFAKGDGNSKVLYVSVGHSTYRESAPHTAYVMAIDMSDMSVIWKSEPAVCNSNNFVIEGDCIICGYGFTKEDDYIYILNRYDGSVIERIKVKTSPEYFALNDGKLYVKTYDTDYVYEIETLDS